MPEILDVRSAGPSKFSVKSLLHIAVRKLALFPEMHLENLHFLPVHLKTELLSVATKGGKLSNETLKPLLHENVLELDLRECPTCDKTIENLYVCRNLEKLNINSGVGDVIDISTSVLKNLFPNIPSLSVLYIRRCDGVSDEAIEILAASCPLLSELDVEGSSMITDVALKYLKNLEHLISLNLSSTKVSDRGVVSLVRGNCAETLTELRLANCEGITDFAIEIIVLYCSNMKMLIFHGCSVTAHLVPDVTDAATYSYPTNQPNP